MYPIAGIAERAWTPNHPDDRQVVSRSQTLSVIDLDLDRSLVHGEPCGTAIPASRGEEAASGARLDVWQVCAASTALATLPIYTAAKHGINGFVRSFGKYLPEEQITINAVVSLKFLSPMSEVEAHCILSHPMSSEQIFRAAAFYDKCWRRRSYWRQ